MAKLIIKIFSGIGVFIVVSFLLFMGTYYATSSPEFCSGCHFLKPYVVSWETSPHEDVHCFKCHEFPGPPGMLHSKSRGIAYVYQTYISKDYTVPTRGIVFESNCIRCHLGDYQEFENAPRMKTQPTNHLEIVKKDKSCLDCHNTVGHDINIGLEQEFKQ